MITFKDKIMNEEIIKVINDFDSGQNLDHSNIFLRFQ